ncbi:MAG: TonB family protein [Burkholderiales bacterium]|nr:TonB family protein [Burkholderiales bacterium]
MAYAVVTGLARKVIDVVKAPLETKIIEEIKKPPPPDTPPPPPPKMVQVMPTFVPPPEVQIQAPTIQQPVISNTSPVAPPVYAPPAPPVQAAPPSSGPAQVGVACPNFRETLQNEFKYPPQARKDGVSGEVLLEFTVAANGEIKDVDVKSSTNRVFNSVSVNTVRKFRCLGQGRDVRVQVPIVYKLTD